MAAAAATLAALLSGDIGSGRSRIKSIPTRDAHGPQTSADVAVVVAETFILSSTPATTACPTREREQYQSDACISTMRAAARVSQQSLHSALFPRSRHVGNNSSSPR
jgi:hypothetical protein